ncbi:MAG: hypothetical protein ACRDMV_23330 [Streptosporangiales bacterium]
MLIDCDSCEMRNIACDDCMVTALLGSAPAEAPGAVRIDEGEQAALGALAESGLVPPLRLVRPGEHPGQHGGDRGHAPSRGGDGDAARPQIRASL